MAMQQPDFLPSVFAVNGNYQDIPDTDAGEGRMSWSKGFPVETSQPIAAGGIPPRRIDMNGLGYKLSEHLFFQQSGGMYQWSAELEYPLGAHILGSDSKEYVAIVPSGPSENVGAVDPVTDVNFTAWMPQPRVIADLIYPVGSIYMSVATISPSALFGGSWQRIQGRFLLGSSDTDTLNAQGGARSVQLTVQNMPSHSHTVTLGQAGNHNHTATTSSTGNHNHNRGNMEITGGWIGDNEAAVSAYGAFYGSAASGRGAGNDSVAMRFNFVASRTWTGVTNTTGNHNHTLTTTTTGNHTHSVSVSNTGGGQAFSVMPPYLVVNIWKRVA